jgi:hypothetical protein
MLYRALNRLPERGFALIGLGEPREEASDPLFLLALLAIFAQMIPGAEIQIFPPLIFHKSDRL